jgi:hypothetical protein
MITTIEPETGYFCLPLACHSCGERSFSRKATPM